MPARYKDATAYLRHLQAQYTQPYADTVAADDEFARITRQQVAAIEVTELGGLDWGHSVSDRANV